jgi:stage II sporulation protein AA (anti-sigma F factor antagonist)
LREEIDAKIFEIKPRTLILDLKSIGFMDSSGLGLILGRHSKMKALGGTLKVHNPGSGAARVLKLAAADKIIPIEWTEEKN